MARNITTVTHPDGTVSKRTSARATYTHTVVRGPVDPTVRAAHLEREADTYDALAERNEAAVAAAQTRMVDRGFSRGSSDPDVVFGKPNYHGFEVRLIGSASSWSQDGSKVYPVDVRSNSKGEHEHLTRDEATGEWTKTIIDAREAVIASATALAEGQRARAAALRAEAAQWLSGEKSEDGYSVLRWSSREDLAAKAAAGEFAYLVERGHAVTVVPVD